MRLQGIYRTVSKQSNSKFLLGRREGVGSKQGQIMELRS